MPLPYLALAGNIGRVDFITENEYDLFVRPDTCNPRVRQANTLTTIGNFHSAKKQGVYLALWEYSTPQNVTAPQN